MWLAIRWSVKQDPPQIVERHSSHSQLSWTHLKLNSNSVEIHIPYAFFEHTGRKQKLSNTQRRATGKSRAASQSLHQTLMNSFKKKSVFTMHFIATELLGEKWQFTLCFIVAPLAYSSGHVYKRRWSPWLVKQTDPWVPLPAGSTRSCLPSCIETSCFSFPP